MTLEATAGLKKKTKLSRTERHSNKGQLRIGDHWNAITILALSQSNPLKAIAEFVENSIDAEATRIHIFRGKKNGQTFLRIVDNGKGIPKDETGAPDFKYVATHICNSIKKRLKTKGIQGLQGEFGIGLLSFWTVGEQLTIRSSDIHGHVHQIILRKGQSSYEISKTRALLSEQGTELLIQPLLSGLKQLSGEKLQWYLGLELRNRILERGVEIHIHDLISRNEYLVEPQRYEGSKLVLPVSDGLKTEIYLNIPSSSNRVALYRKGTRVIEDLTALSELDPLVWGAGYFTGFIDCADIQLTPGTRLGIIQDNQYAAMIQSLLRLEAPLREELAGVKRTEEERASTATYATLHKAFRDAFGSLPPEEYDWFDLGNKSSRSRSAKSASKSTPNDSNHENRENQENREDLGNADELSRNETETQPVQPAFFEIAGPLSAARISPSSTLVPIDTVRKLRAVARDRKGAPVSEGLQYHWEIQGDNGNPLVTLSDTDSQEVTLQALKEPGVLKIALVVKQRDIETRAEATVTVTDSILNRRDETAGTRKGLPSFTYERFPGEAWRSRFDVPRNLIVINTGHRDFLFACSKPQLKLRYLVRLFSKELVLANFQGLPAAEILDRQIEISLRAEEFLR